MKSGNTITRFKKVYILHREFMSFNRNIIPLDLLQAEEYARRIEIVIDAVSAYEYMIEKIIINAENVVDYYPDNFIRLLIQYNQMSVIDKHTITPYMMSICNEVYLCYQQHESMQDSEMEVD